MYRIEITLTPLSERGTRGVFSFVSKASTGRKARRNALNASLQAKDGGNVTETEARIVAVYWRATGRDAWSASLE